LGKRETGRGGAGIQFGALGVSNDNRHSRSVERHNVLLDRQREKKMFLQRRKGGAASGHW
jgi:hypothetical protein